jgi:hypothetical protein
MFNEKIIQYAITFTLWVQTGNQANAPYSSIAFQRYQECSSKHDGFEDLIVTKPIKPPYNESRWVSQKWTQIHNEPTNSHMGEN